LGREASRRVRAAEKGCVTDRLLTAEELATRLGVPSKWPLAQARAGHIPHVRLGRYVRFDPADVDA
jgi:excisionase family DNA binding protein